LVYECYLCLMNLALDFPVLMFDVFWDIFAFT
jgi:hypothetical protein